MKTCFTKSFHFCASHKLWDKESSDSDNIEKFGKCTHLHGHNFELQVTVSGAIEADTGMIIPADRLESIVQELVVQKVDHKHLNEDVPWLAGKMPTTEVFVSSIWEVLDSAINEYAKSKSHNVQLQKLLLQETPKISATIER